MGTAPIHDHYDEPYIFFVHVSSVVLNQSSSASLVPFF